MQKVIILPLDGLANGKELIGKMKSILKSPDIKDMVACVKLNDGLHNFDMGGPEIVREIQEVLGDIGIFIDLKIYDVSATIVNTVKKYAGLSPTILTVSSGCSVDAILKIRRTLPSTKVAMVSVPTDISEMESRLRFGMSPRMKILNDFENILNSYESKLQPGDNPNPFDLIVCSALELDFLKKNLPPNIGFIVPGIRDIWMKKKDEHQKRTVGVAEAIVRGATYVVMGAQLTKGNPELEISAEESRKLTLKEIIKTHKLDPLVMLSECQGYYKAFRNEDGKIVSPLVAYAGTYETDSGPKNFVGFEYFNFSQAEYDPHTLSYFADLLSDKITESGLAEICDVVVAAPMGGICLGKEISSNLGTYFAFAEKKVIALADSSKGIKEKSQLVLERHEIAPGSRVILIEDVCNNFSSTEKLKAAIEAKGAELIAIACAFNRSGEKDWKGIPVISAAFIPTSQYRQDHPYIADAIQAGNVSWKPKSEWDMLMEISELVEDNKYIMFEDRTVEEDIHC